VDRDISDQKHAVAVLGLGAMGLPLAARLAETNMVDGFDPDPARRDLASQQHVRVHQSARAAAAAADVIFVAVRNGQQLEQLLFGDTGLSAVLRRGTIIVLTSTVGTGPIAPLVIQLAELGVHLVDAPLSGGPARARAGDLLIVVGAAPEILAAVQPLLDALGSAITVVGDTPGDGQALKTVNQLLCGIHIAAAAEAMALAAAMGLDLDKALKALESGAAGSFMLSNRAPRMIGAYRDENVEVLSRLDIFVKDMAIVSEASRALGTVTPVAAAAEQLYRLGGLARMMTPRLSKFLHRKKSHLTND
jgi:3-hydroxyisobutyrate dehydrogenase